MKITEEQFGLVLFKFLADAWPSHYDMDSENEVLKHTPESLRPISGQKTDVFNIRYINNYERKTVSIFFKSECGRLLLGLTTTYAKYGDLIYDLEVHYPHGKNESTLMKTKTLLGASLFNSLEGN